MVHNGTNSSYGSVNCILLDLALSSEHLSLHVAVNFLYSLPSFDELSMV